MSIGRRRILLPLLTALIAIAGCTSGPAPVASDTATPRIGKTFAAAFASLGGPYARYLPEWAAACADIASEGTCAGYPGTPPAPASLRRLCTSLGGSGYEARLDAVAEEGGRPPRTFHPSCEYPGAIGVPRFGLQLFASRNADAAVCIAARTPRDTACRTVGDGRLDTTDGDSGSGTSFARALWRPHLLATAVSVVRSGETPRAEVDREFRALLAAFGQADPTESATSSSSRPSTATPGTTRTIGEFSTVPAGSPVSNAEDVQKLDQPELRCAGSQVPGQPFVADPVVRADVNGDGARDTLAIVFCNGNGAQPSAAVLYLAGKDGTGPRRASLLTWNGALNAPVPQRIGFNGRIVVTSIGCTTVDRCGAGADLRYTDYFRVAT